LVQRLTDYLGKMAFAVNELVSRSETPLDTTSVTVGASPFTYTAARDGFVSITGGAVTGISYSRQGVSFSVGLSGVVPVKKGDAVVITYSSTPTVRLI
jgi:hypothetical protein